MSRVHYRVDFNASCGAQHTPAFNKAEHRPGTLKGRLTLYFPVNTKGLLKNRWAQLEWAEDKEKHLRSFNNSEPKVWQMLDGNMCGSFWIDPETNRMEPGL